MVKQWENRIFKTLSTFSLLIGKADLLAVVTAEGGPQKLRDEAEGGHCGEI